MLREEPNTVPQAWIPDPSTPANVAHEQVLTNPERAFVKVKVKPLCSAPSPAGLADLSTSVVPGWCR